MWVVGVGEPQHPQPTTFPPPPCGIIVAEAKRMVVRIRVHYDGKTIVPDEPVDLPVGEALEVEVRVVEPKLSAAEIKRRRAALRRITSRAIPGLNIPDEALRRENMYEDRL